MKRYLPSGVNLNLIGGLMMRLSALIMLLLISLGSAEDDSQASQESPASADYQAGFARGLELGMEVVTLLNAAPYNPNASQFFNQRALEFNRELDLVFGQGSNLSKKYRLQPFGLAANNTTNIIEEQTVKNTSAENITVNNTAAADGAVNLTAVNLTAMSQINLTAVSQIADKQTAENPIIEQRKSLKNESTNSKNETETANEAAIPKFIGSGTIAAGDSIDEDLGDIIKDWNGNPEVPPESMAGMPGPETV
jgi:hypothetical protein